MSERLAPDVVSRLVGQCLQSRETAERLFEDVIAARRRRIVVDGEALELSEDQLHEFVERFSTEVEPAFWESKRLKH